MTEKFYNINGTELNGIKLFCHLCQYFCKCFWFVTGKSFRLDICLKVGLNLFVQSDAGKKGFITLTSGNYVI